MIKWGFEQGSNCTFPVRLLVYIRFLLERKEGKWFYCFINVIIMSPSIYALISL